MKLLKHDLDLLAIGRVHRYEMKTLRKATNQLRPDECSVWVESTLAFFTSAGVASSKRCDIFLGLLSMLRLLTLSIGVLALKWEESWAARWTERNMERIEVGLDT